MTEPSFEFVSPVIGARVATSFTVRGICEYLKVDPTLTITVTYTSGNYSRSSTAESNAGDCTFEASFQDVTPGTGTVTAYCDASESPPQITDVTVDSSLPLGGSQDLDPH